MCLNIKKNGVGGKIAEKDITCYKVVNMNEDGLYIPVFYPNITYTPEALNPHVGIVPTPSIYFHALNVERGYHSYTNIRWAEKFTTTTEKIVKCTIPKGTKYYEGVDGNGFESYASENIIVNGLAQLSKDIE
jgi:hypothetical protein